MLKKVLSLPAKKDDESLLVMVCGPPGFMKLISGEKTKDFKQVFIVKIFLCILYAHKARTAFNLLFLPRKKILLLNLINSIGIFFNFRVT